MLLEIEGFEHPRKRVHDKNRENEKMKKILLILPIVLAGCVSIHSENCIGIAENSQLVYILPSPKTESNVSVEEALTRRRSRRNFQNKELSIEKLSQILWAAYGITGPRSGLRTTPSAGALYPLEIYVVVGNVTGIEAGVYKYVVEEHKIIRTIDKDIRTELSLAVSGQAMVKNAPVTVVYTAIFSRTTRRYGERGRERYVFAELGHSAQNIYLQAETLGLGTVAIGAFIDDKASELLKLPAEKELLYFMPIGHLTSN